MDFINGPGTANKEQGEKSCIVSHNSNKQQLLFYFHRQVYFYFANCACLQCLYANKSSIREGENRPEEPDSYSTLGISPKLTAAELSVRSLK